MEEKDSGFQRRKKVSRAEHNKEKTLRNTAYKREFESQLTGL